MPFSTRFWGVRSVSPTTWRIAVLKNMVRPEIEDGISTQCIEALDTFFAPRRTSTRPVLMSSRRLGLTSSCRRRRYFGKGQAPLWQKPREKLSGLRISLRETGVFLGHPGRGAPSYETVEVARCAGFTRERDAIQSSEQF